MSETMSAREAGGSCCASLTYSPRLLLSEEVKSMAGVEAQVD